MIGHESQTDSHEQHPLKDHTSQLLSMVFLKINGTDLYPNFFFSSTFRYFPVNSQATTIFIQKPKG